MSYFVVTYTYVPDETSLDRIRPLHREYLASLAGDTLVASGPFVNPSEPSAMLLFEAADATAVIDQLDDDPFWEAELIAERTITEWNPVIGSLG